MADLGACMIFACCLCVLCVCVCLLCLCVFCVLCVFLCVVCVFVRVLYILRVVFIFAWFIYEHICVLQGGKL